MLLEEKTFEHILAQYDNRISAEDLRLYARFSCHEEQLYYLLADHIKKRDDCYKTRIMGSKVLCVDDVVRSYCSLKGCSDKEYYCLRE